jgi:aryl-alcohol dehydrogenase-like predicted oxidoreductase/HEAT repeat protein
MFARARRLTFRLLDPASAEEAARLLRGVDGPGVVEGLCLLAERASGGASAEPGDTPRSSAKLGDTPRPPGEEAAAGVAAVRALAGRQHPRAREAVGAALAAGAVAIRVEAALALEALPEAAHAPVLARLVREDEAPVVRRAALHALAKLGPEHAAALVPALGDPVWRLRRDAILRLSAPPPVGLGLARGAPIERPVAEAIAALAPLDAATRGALEYLARRTGVRPDAPVTMGDTPMPPAPALPAWWNEDPAVLLASLRHEDVATIVRPGIVDLLAFEDSRPYNDCAGDLRALAATALERAGSIEDFIPVVALLGDPRRPFVRRTVLALLARLAPERRATVALRVLAAADAPVTLPPAPALVWAIEHAPSASVSVPGLRAHPAAAVRTAAVRRMAADGAPAEGLLPALDDPDDDVRVAALAGLHGVPLDLAGAGGGPAFRAARARHRILYGDRAPALAEALEDADARVRAAAAGALAERDPTAPELAILAADADDRVRAAALTRAGALALWAAIEGEPSVRVIARAAELCDRPLAEVAPAPRLDLHPVPDVFGVEPSESPYLLNRPSIDARERIWAARRASGVPARPADPPAPCASDRPFGTTGLRLPPLAFSGRYGLPEPAFDEALDRGARLFFWEPVYEGQTRWLRRLSGSRRAGVRLIAGSFEADPRAVRSDAEAALRLLRVEAIDVFVLFWARSPERLSDDVLDVMSRLAAAGVIKTFGVSTHRRDLAARAVAGGWPSVMVRHSAAHRGAEAEVFPAARAAGAGVLTFSNLCYGRLLRSEWGDRFPPSAGADSFPPSAGADSFPPSAGADSFPPSAGADPPAPADCYRYSLAQPGVTATISAPRDALQLRENLRVLEDPVLPAERLPALRAFGDKVHRDNREFFELLRWR